MPWEVDEAMIRKMATYRVKKESLVAVIRAVREFVQAVQEQEPETVYTAYRAGGGTDFVHFMAFVDEEAEQLHRAAPYTKKFTDLLYPACETEPVFTELFVVQ
jgi:quinol monooxygenase YgiN